ncbi:GNAT family N-acetyltransferase [Myxococcota bacterium]|nr:GNAT family N-acetyltransferase [Myxococcota bacterium]
MELVTPRLLLRELEVTDWRATNAYESDPDVVRYETFGTMTAEESLAYIERALEDAQDEPRLTWDLAVVLRPSGPLIGRCGVQLTKPELREATLWYILSKHHWGRGYATEAARTMMDFAFAKLGAHRVIADADPRNTRSVRVLEKLGLRREAHFRENQHIKGEWCDSVVYAMLDHEWSELRAREERAARRR